VTNSLISVNSHAVSSIGRKLYERLRDIPQADFWHLAYMFLRPSNRSFFVFAKPGQLRQVDQHGSNLRLALAEASKKLIEFTGRTRGLLDAANYPTFRSFPEGKRRNTTSRLLSPGNLNIQIIWPWPKRGKTLAYLHP